MATTPLRPPAAEPFMAPAADRRHGTSRLRIGLGTFIAIDASARTSQDELKGIESAYEAIALVERLMHPARTGSDLAAIHRAAPGRPVSIHAWTAEVLALSQRLGLLSAGAFDPCLPDSAGRISDLDFAAPNVVIAHRPLRIDLGGIAKGYAVDRALLALRDSGCRGGLVNAGGDLAVFGDRSHSVIVAGRRARAGIALELKDSALASSDVCAAARPSEHGGYYHGAGGRRIVSGRVSISAASAAIADGLTKCLLADFSETGAAALLEKFGARLVAYDS